MADVLVKLENITKVYGTEKNPVYALRDVSLEVYEHEYVSIMGPSGSGKTTLFNMIGALDRCSEGTVIIGEVNLSQLKDGELAFFRGRHIGYIFQSYNLIASMTALKNVSLPALMMGATQQEAHRPDELSGGQQQRVAIARALVNNPTIILADEPTGNLDLHTGEEIIDLLQHFCRELGVTVITATHDHKMLKASDRIVWIKDGSVDRIERADAIEIDEGGIEEATAADEAVRGEVEGHGPASPEKENPAE